MSPMDGKSHPISYSLQNCGYQTKDIMLEDRIKVLHATCFLLSEESHLTLRNLEVF